ncbi:unnamed protein product [Nippostrongylus brasiliensis]|uniref:ZT_dimer domain-containing protein n=1 Tax=Nippostrongylus brasiliensis TaxID=27835 RepID=A0A0N4XY69_NIPBR|nr:unnamed protein product [Nippostrongylus brasiliensis]
MNNMEKEQRKLYGQIPVARNSLLNSTPKITYCERRRRAREKAKYYQHLAELQELFEYDRRLCDGDEAALERELGPDRILARFAFTLNTFLLVVNLLASIVTGSLSIISTFVDSFMDITTSIVLGTCLWLINNTNNHKYPRGRGRLELLGVILCSIIMGTANMFLVVESISAIISGQAFLMVLCYKRGSASSKVLAMDMRNDIIMTFVAVFCATFGYLFWPYVDPLGAIIVCALIAISWFHNAMEHVPILVGVRGERDHLCRTLKIMVYHTGIQATVEIHIVMDEHLPLKVTHDICHPLERKLQKLDFIEKAFVHCDYAEAAISYCNNVKFDFKCTDNRVVVTLRLKEHTMQKQQEEELAFLQEPHREQAVALVPEAERVAMEVEG